MKMVLDITHTMRYDENPEQQFLPEMKRLQTIQQQISGVVLVSTGILKLGKPSAGRDRAANRTININADEQLAYAA